MNPLRLQAPSPKPSSNTDDALRAADAKIQARKVNDLKRSVGIALGLGILIAVGVLLGFIPAFVGILVFVLILVAMLVLHGGATSMASGLSDHEGYEKELEEEEQRKAEEAEYYGETPSHDDSE